MFVSNGTTYGYFNGLVWDGQGKAAYGIDYNSTGNPVTKKSNNIFETRNLHRNEHFKSFIDAGFAVGVFNGGLTGHANLEYKKEAAESMIQNCIFEDCHKGVGLENFNDYDWAIDGCTFTDCDFGIYVPVHRDANYDVHQCRFERSKIADLTIAAEASNARQIVSVGSRRLLTTVNWPGKPGAVPARRRE